MSLAKPPDLSPLAAWDVRAGVSALTLCDRTGPIPVETLQKTINLTKICFACIETYIINNR